VLYLNQGWRPLIQATLRLKLLIFGLLCNIYKMRVDGGSNCKYLGGSFAKAARPKVTGCFGPWYLRWRAQMNPHMHRTSMRSDRRPMATILNKTRSRSSHRIPDPTDHIQTSERVIPDLICTIGYESDDQRLSPPIDDVEMTAPPAVQWRSHRRDG
jgi:hypothetical protein